MAQTEVERRLVDEMAKLSDRMEDVRVGVEGLGTTVTTGFASMARDLKHYSDQVTIMSSAAQAAQGAALRAETQAELAAQRADFATREMSTRAQTLPDIARAAGAEAGREEAETITGRFRVPSDPVRAIVDSRLDEREIKRVASRMQWWKSKAAETAWAAAKWSAMPVGYAILRGIEYVIRGH